MKRDSQLERVHFRLIRTDCCGHLLCWVNPRFPTHCPECGKLCYPSVKGWVLISDPEAQLKYDAAKLT
jgi:hypothetical protein